MDISCYIVGEQLVLIILSLFEVMLYEWAYVCAACLREDLTIYATYLFAI